MKNQLLHTPEGVRDIYNEEYEKKLLLQARLSDMLRRYGYMPIQTPTFEFFDIFGKEIGTIPSKDLYKFFDHEGNTLVLRPDITPSIARSAVKYFGEEDMPLRLSYMGNIFINHAGLQGRLKETTQLGAELIGISGSDADAELLAMVVECLKAAGLKEFQICVGHAEFFRGLVEAAGLDEEREDELRSLISNKNYFGVEEFVETLNLNEDLKQLFSLLGKLYTDTEEFVAVREHAADYPRILSTLKALDELHKVLKLYDISRYISFEPGIVSDYKYYTGILFSGYTFGSGEPIVKGGRYDKLLTYFGKNLAASGFAFVVDQLMAALSRQKIELRTERKTELIVYTADKRKDAILLARDRRTAGGFVELLPYDDAKSEDDYQAYAKKRHVTELTFLR